MGLASSFGHQKQPFVSSCIVLCCCEVNLDTTQPLYVTIFYLYVKKNSHQIKINALKSLLQSSDGRVVKASASGAVDLGLISSRVKPMTLKLVFTASLLDAHH